MVVRFLALLAFLLSSSAFAATVTTDQLRRHIEILASDDYQGREPGTEGETRTIAYISAQFQAAGLEPAGPNGSWYQPVGLVTRTPLDARNRWKGKGAPFSLEDELILVGDHGEERIRHAPVVFAGHGAVIPERGIDQLAGVDLKGAVALILFDAPDVEGFPDFGERAKAVTDRGAAAVIGIIGDDIPWQAVQGMYRAGRHRLEIDGVPPIQGVMSQAAAARLALAAGTDLAHLLDLAPGPSFRAVALDLQASLNVRTEVKRLSSNNVVGRLRGSAAAGQSVLVLGHWDHFGFCRPEGAADRICNGAVDNASGIAELIETARGLSTGLRPKRDVLFLATTSEEEGLLGAEYFAARPIVPLGSIVAALNLDTVAIGHKGEKVTVVGHGIPTLDGLIAQTVHEQGRQMDGDQEADSFSDRQDGWALRRAGVPAVMVGGAFSDMEELGRFLAGAYHQPNDDLAHGIVLDGAAEDTDLSIALTRKLADPALYQHPAPSAVAAAR
jgi:hypothetical protein